MLTVRRLEKVGSPDEGVNVHEAPAGSPLLHERPTDSDPSPRLAVIVFEPDLPVKTTILPEFDNEKSNGRMDIVMDEE